MEPVYNPLATVISANASGLSANPMTTVATFGQSYGEGLLDLYFFRAPAVALDTQAILHVLGSSTSVTYSLQLHLNLIFFGVFSEARLSLTYSNGLKSFSSKSDHFAVNEDAHMADDLHTS